MTRFSGLIGLNRGSVESPAGIFTQRIEEVLVNGEMRQLGQRWPQQSMETGLNARHVLSVVTPEDNIIDFTEAVYIWWQGRKWAVVAIEYKRPRVELSLGGLYNG